MSDLPDIPEDLELPPEAEAEVEAGPEVSPEDTAVIETEAAKYGWKPQGKGNIPAAVWVDAAKFMTLPSTQVRIYRDKERAWEKDKAELAARVAKSEGMMTTVAERIRAQEKAAYDARLAEIQREQRAAAEVGDVAKFDALAQQREVLRPPQDVAPVQGPDPELTSYIAANEWTKDPILWDFAKRAVDLSGGAAGTTTQQQIAYAEQKVREFFPHKFAPRTMPNRVDGGGLGGMRKSLASQLPADVAKVGEGFVKQGLFKNIEEYARDYLEGKA